MEPTARTAELRGVRMREPTPAELAAIEAIKQLKARYFRCLDTHDWEGLAEVFAPNAELDVRDDAGDERGILRGREEIVGRIRSAMALARSVHHGHMPEIEITGPTTARGIWAMEDRVEFPGTEGRSGFHGAGHYTETYEVVGGRWRIATSRLTRLRREPLR